MVVLDDVVLMREGQTVFSHLSCTLAMDERVVLLGGSGAGKTTFLRLVLGLVHPDSGRVLVDGADLAAISDDELRQLRLRFGLVFQEGALFDSLTVGDNVAFYLREQAHLPEAEVQDRTNEMLARVGLIHAKDLMPEELSGGMQRRAAIARSMVAQEPEMLLYDEPTSDLDPYNAEVICRLIIDLTAHGRGFLVVTHEIFHALSLGQRFLFLNQGKLEFDGTREELIKSDNPHLRRFVGELYWEAVKCMPDLFSLEPGAKNP
ncbi:MAG: ATP-binding cassette domain-containing protein [Chitinivibrionales bacterium]|nr:ATP-binding cassette domain-containing protein [Chitinivibrionales bacterium]